MEPLPLPTRKECEALYDILGPVPEETRKHCRLVAEVAGRIGQALNRKGADLNLELIQAAGLLHDIAKGRRNHAEVGGRWLREIGYERLGEIVAKHMDMEVPENQGIKEEAVVYVADKMVKGDRIHSLVDRYQASAARYKDNPEIIEQIKGRWQRAEKMKKRLEKKLARPLEELIV